MLYWKRARTLASYSVKEKKEEEEEGEKEEEGVLLR